MARMPAAVEKLVKEAEEITQAVYGKTAEGAPGAPEQTAAPQVATDGSAMPAAPAAPPAPSAETAPASAPAVETVPKAEYDRLLQQHNVLKGKYDAEVPRYAEMVRQLKEENAKLTGENASMKATLEKSKLTPQQKEEWEKSRKEMAEAYDEKFVGDIEKITAAAVAEAVAVHEAKIAELQSQLQSVTGSVQQTTQETRAQAFFSQLTALVPSWREVFADPGFATWLQEEEGNSGMTRFQLASSFQGQGDAPRVAKFYKDYIAKKGTPPGAANVAATGKEALIAPGSTPSSSATAGGDQGDVPWVRASELDKLAQDKIRGVYRGRDAELAAIEARHAAAQRAGRILAGQ